MQQVQEPASIQTPLGTFALSRYKTFFNTSKPVQFGFRPTVPSGPSGIPVGNSVRRPVWQLGYADLDAAELSLVPADGEDRRFILKCQSDSVPLVPELEALMLEMAALAGLEIPDYRMVETPEAQTALLIKRSDAPVRGKPYAPVSPVIEHASAGVTWEQLAAEVKRGSSNSGFDLLGVLERALFAYLTGAYNVSVRKFFLVTLPDGQKKLGPISGYLPMLVMFSKQIDPQDFAFPLNGKTRKLTVQDFLFFGSSVGLYGKQIDNAVKRFADVLPVWEAAIRKSALPGPIRNEFISLIELKAGRLMIRRRF